MSANNRQVGGSHYSSDIQHWDYVVANELDYFQGQITKYVTRWKKKNGVADLEKAKHFLDKYIELETNKLRAKVPPAFLHTQPIERGALPPKVTRLRLEQDHPFGFDVAKDI